MNENQTGIYPLHGKRGRRHAGRMRRRKAVAGGRSVAAGTAAAMTAARHAFRAGIASLPGVEW